MVRAVSLLVGLVGAVGLVGCLPPPLPPQAVYQPTPAGAAPAAAPATEPADPYAAPATAGEVATAPAAPAAPAQPVPAQPAVAAAPQPQSAITFALPAGFTEQQGWYWQEKRSPHWKTDWVTTGLVRVFAPVAAQGDLGDAARAAWNRHVPPEIRGAQSKLVIRRYVGDGLRAYYVHGRGQEQGQGGESWFAMHMVDCGAVWQPVLVVAKFHESGSQGIDKMTINFELPGGFDLAEPMVQALRCAGPKNAPLYDASSIVGHYYFGSSANMDYVNVHTGSTSSSHVNFAGEYDLRADGSATYVYGSASNFQGGPTRFGSDGGEGTWKVAGDMLTIQIKGKVPYVFRLASMTDTGDGRVGIWLDPKSWWLPSALWSGTVVSTQKASN
jgi:hypothetical protein